MTTQNKNVPALRFSEFNEDWKEKKYGEIFSFKTTNSYSRENLNYETGEVKNIHYGDIHTKFKTLFDITKEYVPFINEEISLKKIAEDNYCKVGDLVTADASEDYADIGKCIEIIKLNNEKVLAGLHTFLARPSLYKIESGFSGYLMQSRKIRLQIMTIAQGTKVLGLATGRLAKIKLDIPETKEQKKIAAFLMAVDEKIQQLAKKKDLLEQYKKGVVQKIFSQQIRFKDDNGNGFADWKEKKLCELDIYISDGNYGELYPKSSEMKSSGVPFIRANNIKELKLTWDDMRFIDDDLHSTLKSGHLKTNDILVTTRGDIGMVAYVTEEFNGANINAQICLLRVNENTNSKYLLQFLGSKSGKAQFKKLQTGSALKQLPKKNLDCVIIPIPKIEEQNKIANLLTAIDDKINSVNQQLEKTQTFKKGLLQQMFI